MSKNKHKYVEKSAVNNDKVNTVDVIDNSSTEDVNITPTEQTIHGMVVKCEKLNVREKPTTNARVICVVDAYTEVIIDMTNSIGKWFKVCTESGIEGYCMNDFIQIK